MSRRGNCWDNAVAESFFSSLKKERIKKRIYKDRETATKDIADYIDHEEFLLRIANGDFDDDVAAMFHQGACSDTMATDGRYMMRNNYRYSVTLLEHCQDNDIPFIYASSASVYGAGTAFREDPANEAPLNVKISAGIASASRISASAEMDPLIEKARFAVARAKEAGGNQVFLVFV